MAWRHYLNKNLKPYIERLIIESSSYKEIYSLAKDKGKAQLWIALAILYKQINNIEVKLDYLEKTLQDVAGSKIKVKEESRRRKEEKEVEKFIRDLSQSKISKSKIKIKGKKSKKKIKKKIKNRKKILKGIKIAKSL